MQHVAKMKRGRRLKAVATPFAPERRAADAELSGSFGHISSIIAEGLKDKRCFCRLAFMGEPSRCPGRCFRGDKWLCADCAQLPHGRWLIGPPIPSRQTPN